MALDGGGVGLAKTTRPRSSAVFPRERLFYDLDANRAGAATWIAAPPGAGKTMLLASFVAERAMPCLWYQVDQDDGDPSAFFAHLAAATYSALGASAPKLPTFTPDAAFSLLTFARQFFRELFGSAPELLLVLDDYHEAPAHGPLDEIVRVCIEQVPSGAHVVVASRTPAPTALARARANGAMRTVSWQQLMLTADDVIGIAGLHGLALGHQAAEEWRERCGAWAAGLRLMLMPDVAASVGRPDSRQLGVVFEYLGHEVFQRLPQALQSCLLKLSALPRIPADAIAELVDSTTAESELAAMAEQNLFTTVTTNGPRTYRFHPLFRDFLRQTARARLTAPDFLEQHRRAARALQSRSLIDDAAQVLIEGAAWHDLGQLVLEHAARLLSQGRNATVNQWLLQLPDEQVKRNSWLLYWLGASRAWHDPLAGRADLERAFEMFARDDDRVGTMLAWSGAVDCIFNAYGDLTQLDAWISRLDEMLASGATFASPEVEARVTFSMFVILSFRQPQHPDLAIWRSRLGFLVGIVPDPMFRLLARLHLIMGQIWAGDLSRAGAELKSLQRETAARPTTPLLELIGHLARSTLALYAGDVATCFDAIEKGLAIAEISEIHIWDKILLGQGAALALSYGDVARGKSLALRRAGFAKVGDAEERSLYHSIEAWACWLNGEVGEALAQIKLATSFARTMGLPHFYAVDCLSVAVVSFECGDVDGSLRQVEVGRELGVSTRNLMLGWMADMVEAYVRIRLRETAPALALIENAMQVGKAHGYRHFFFWPRHAMALVCLTALEAGIEPDHVRATIERGGLTPPPEGADSECWPWPVRLVTLGSFAVTVRGSAVTFEGKAQRTPLRLLKALIAFGGHDVAETKIIDALWPDSDGGAGEQALSTTLFRLRKLVGTSTIWRQDGHLGINATECWIDCHVFDKTLRHIKQLDSEAIVDKVRRLYAGPFLQGEDDAPWAMGLRERLHVAFVKKLSASAAHALTEGRTALAAAICEAGLEVDDLVEEFYRGQIHCHMANNQASLAVTTYRRCQRILSSRLGVMPSQATTSAYLAALRHQTD